MLIRSVHPPTTRDELIRVVAMLLQDAFSDVATVGSQTDGVALAFEHHVEEELEGDLVLLLLDRDAWMGYRDSLKGKTDQADDDDEDGPPLRFNIAGVN